MLLTEEEAKTKRCQESFGDGWTVPDGRMVSPQEFMRAVIASPSHCIGSGCMAWHWNEPQPYEYGKDFAKGHVPADPGWEAYDTYTVIEGNGIVTYERWRRAKPGRVGFCGKANHPPCTCS